MIIQSLSKKYLPSEETVRRAVKKALKHVNKHEFNLEVYLVSNSIMKQINRRFRGKNKPANVLAFPSYDFLNPQFKKYLGEIYLAPDYIRSRGESLIQMAIHGLLHLLGYTHESRRDRIKMERLEKKLDSLLAIKLKS